MAFERKRSFSLAGPGAVSVVRVSRPRSTKLVFAIHTCACWTRSSSWEAMADEQGVEGVPPARKARRIRL